MAVEVVTTEYSDLREFSLFFEKELTEGRAVVQGDAKVELFDEIILRVVVEQASVDIVATVAHPALPDPSGRPMLGLAVRLNSDQRHLLSEMLELLVRKRTQTDDPEPSRDRGIEVVGEQDLAATNIGRPVFDAITSRPQIDHSRLDDMFGATPEFGRPAPATPVNSDVFASMIAATAAQRTPAFDSVDEDRPIRGSVDDIIDSVARGEACSEGDAFNREDAAEAARYRALYPDKAMRSDDYYRAAKADARNRKFELARTNINLAIAYNPTVSEYRELLEQVELELGVFA